MKYAVDKILDGIATIENIETGEIKNISINNFPKDIKEGNIVIEKTRYIIDKKEESKRRKTINNKLNSIKVKKTNL